MVVGETSLERIFSMSVIVWGLGYILIRYCRISVRVVSLIASPILRPFNSRLGMLESLFSYYNIIIFKLAALRQVYILPFSNMVLPLGKQEFQKDVAKVITR